MNRISHFILLLIATLVAGCQTTHQSGHPQTNGITQIATLDALMAGGYDGHATLAKLRHHGDFGLGTYDRLDGEMILLDGNFHQVRVDGKSYTPDFDCTSPFACVTHFQLDTMEVVREPLTMMALQNRVDALIPDQNIFCAIKVRGIYNRMKTRSVSAQIEPYRPLAEVTKDQTVFDYTDVRGTLVGFRCPPFVQGLNVVGYHLHFISDDRKTGGHVLDFELSEGEIEIDSEHEFFHVLLPETRGTGGL